MPPSAIFSIATPPAQRWLLFAVLLCALSGCSMFSGGDEAEQPPPPPPVLEPACSDPAPLKGEYEPHAPGYIFTLTGGVENRTPEEVRALVRELADTYDFEPKGVYEHALAGFFVEELPPEVLAALRCEPIIKEVSYNDLYSLYSPGEQPAS